MRGARKWMSANSEYGVSSYIFLDTGLEMGHNRGPELFFGAVFNVFPHGFFQHCLEMTAFLAGDFSHCGQQLRRCLTGEFLS